MFKIASICPLVLGLAIALWGGCALAQSTTNCMAMGPTMVHCDTMNMAPPYTPNTAPQASSDGGEELGRGLARLIVRTREDAFRKRLGKMLADGDCQGAARAAFESGRLELGQSIKATCPPNDAQVISVIPR